MQNEEKFINLRGTGSNTEEESHIIYTENADRKEEKQTETGSSIKEGSDTL
jgi:hypothetical protein